MTLKCGGTTKGLVQEVTYMSALISSGATCRRKVRGETDTCQPDEMPVDQEARALISVVAPGALTAAGERRIPRQTLLAEHTILGDKAVESRSFVSASGSLFRDSLNLLMRTSP